MIVTLQRRVIPQPQPHLHPGGDCGACVLGGLVGLSVPEVYERYRKKIDSFDYWSMRDALYRAESDGRLDRIVTDVPSWPVEPMISTWGALTTLQGLAWIGYVRMASDAGYYGIAGVDILKRGAYGGGPNHWVLICGVRERHEPVSDKGSRIIDEVLVSCSSATTPDEEWVCAGEFLRDRGGFNLFLARPA